MLSICWALSGLLPKVSWRFRTPRGRQNRSGKPQRKNGGLGAYVNRCLCSSGTIPWRGKLSPVGWVPEVHPSSEKTASEKRSPGTAFRPGWEKLFT